MRVFIIRVYIYIYIRPHPFPQTRPISLPHDFLRDAGFCNFVTSKILPCVRPTAPGVRRGECAPRSSRHAGTRGGGSSARDLRWSRALVDEQRGERERKRAILINETTLDGPDVLRNVVARRQVSRDALRGVTSTELRLP